jgi:hypothetical protein
MALEPIRPKDLPPSVTVYATDRIPSDDGVNVGGALPVQIVDAGAPVPSEATAIAGIDNVSRMTPFLTRAVLNDETAPSVLLAQAWAESPSPPIPGSKSSKTWAGESAASATAAAMYDGPWLDTVSALIADTSLTYAPALPGTVVAGDYVQTRKEGFAYQVAASGASDHHVTTAGGVKLYVQAGPSGFSVTAFGAHGDGVADDTLAIQTTITAAAAAMSAAYLPHGNHKVTSTITIPANGHLIGQSRNGSVLLASGATHVVVLLGGSQAKITRVYVSGGSVGIQNLSNSAPMSQIMDCRVSYNRIGILLVDAYITLVKDNYIAFNNWGIVAGAQSFQVIIRDNVIDNNIGGVAGGGGGIFAFSNSGLLIEGNTIEGNRRELTPGGPSTGFGLWLVGLNQRTIVRGNWFEQNGNQSGSADVIISRPVETWVDDLVTNCVPAEYAAQVASGAIITGQVELSGSFFLATQRSIAIKLTSSNYGNISVANNTFVGVKSKNNIPIELFGTGGAKLKIDANNVTNTGDITVDAEMLVGIKNSYVTHTGTVPAFETVMLDGKDLFTGYVTTVQFAALAGASLDATSRFPSSGNSTLKNGVVRAAGGVAGTRVVSGTGRPRAGAAAWFSALSVPYYVALLGDGSGAGYTFTGSGGGSFRAVADASGITAINVVTPVAAEATLHTGDYYGWLIMTAAQYTASNLRGCTRLVVGDLDVMETLPRASTIPTSFASPTLYNWVVGDTVYNTAPVVGGSIGWTCTVAGSPGTWCGFGTVSNNILGSATYDPPSLVDGAGATTTVTVTGAALGDFATASFSLDLQGVSVTAWVSAANTVSVRLQNETGGTIDLASGTLWAMVTSR